MEINKYEIYKLVILNWVIGKILVCYGFSIIEGNQGLSDDCDS